jgi:LysR family cys regulon transcriptional activator
MNLTKAASEIGTTQSALSKRLSQEENKLGVTLVKRKRGTDRLAKLTPAGEYLLDEGMKLLTHANRIQIKIRELGHAKQDLLMTASLELAVTKTLLAIQSALLNRELSLSFISVQPQSDITFDMLRKGVIDLALEPHSWMADTHNLQGFPLYREPAIVVLDKTHVLASRNKLSIQEIKSLGFITNVDNTSYTLRKHIHSIGESLGFMPDFVMRTASTQLSVLLTNIGNDILFLPKSYSPIIEATNDRVACIKIEERDCDFDMRLFYRDENDERIATALEIIKPLYPQGTP